MIASGYTMDLYCDGEGCTRGKYELYPVNQSFHDESKSACLRDARAAGWKISWRKQTAFCKHCHSAKKAVECGDT